MSASQSHRVATTHSFATPTAKINENYHSSLPVNFCSGAIALSSAFTVMHPLDTIKTLMQTGLTEQHTQQSKAHTGVLHRWAAFGRPLLRGIAVSAAGAAPQGGLRFVTYEWTKETLRHSIGMDMSKGNQSTSLVVGTSALGAVVGDLASCLVKLPREVITNRLQTGVHSSFRRACSAIYAEEGVAGFYRGFVSTSCRDFPFMILLLVCYENMRIITLDLLEKKRRAQESLIHVSEHMHIPLPHSWHQPSHISNAFNVTTDGGVLPHAGLVQNFPLVDVCKPGSLCSAIFGGVSGSIAGFCTTPFDVIKTKIITANKTKDANAHARPNMRSAIQRIAADARKSFLARQPSERSESMAQRLAYGKHVTKAFFVGAVPRASWWFCVCGIFFPTYERMKKAIN